MSKRKPPHGEFTPNAASQRKRLLVAYLQGPATDDRAAILAGLHITD